MPDRTAGYETDRPDVQAHVPIDASSILELGCSAGALGAALKRRAAPRPLTIVGVELDPAYAATAAERLDRVVVADAETFLSGPAPAEAPFDCLVAADVLEHLADPWTALRRAAELVRPGGTVVVSVPNVLFFGALLRLVRERRWPRDAEGVFDGTHLRWFSRTDAEDLLRSAGLRDIATEPRYWVEGAQLRRRRLLARTPLGPFLPLQHIVTGVR
jgi:2-polyprenyl-3-methyl-5-hydroxy-6-metoxy-1,4-benzoquinol methylase